MAAGGCGVGAFGRVRRDESGRVCDIVEARSGEGGLAERNAGIYVFDGPWLWENVKSVGFSDSGERYLTALASMAHRQGHTIEAVEIDAEDALGVGDRAELAEAEAVNRQATAEQKRLAPLVPTGAVTQSEYDIARARVDTSEGSGRAPVSGGA